MKPNFSVIFMGAFLAYAEVSAGEIERVPPLRDAMTAKECGECHMAFQPALLPAGSWMRIMEKLENHFGDDATLPSDMANRIRDHLTAHSGRAGDPTNVRITEQSWFVGEHRFPARVWQRPEIKAKSNCPACHARAEQGIYDDD